MPPDWSLDSRTVESISMRRTEWFTGASDSWVVSKDTTFHPGHAERLAQVDGDPPAMRWYRDAPENVQQQTELTSQEWASLVSDVAQTGLFRFEGEAAPDSSKVAIGSIRVQRRDRPDAILVATDATRVHERHPTFADVLHRVAELERSLTWEPDDR